tara:strand:- start:209 stop:1615 length:1407 start_codon:yes stop_codon:yes gene_type:complete
MTLQSSGQIKFSDITAEFGQPSGKNIGAYRVSQNIGSLTNLPLDTGIPQSGQISFSNFRGKEANIIVDCHSFGSTNYNQDAYQNRFATGNFNVVGGFRTSVPKSAWQGGKTVIININKQFSSSGASSRNHFALAVGRYNNNNSQHGWPTSTELSVVVGSQGSVVGKGGNGGSGGYGGNAVSNAGNGGEGTSALKIHSGMSISGESRIRGGGGGGGGGVGITGIPESDDEAQVRAFGGGGGGGAGIPAGTGGAGGSTVGDFDGVPEGHTFNYDAATGNVGSPDVTKTFSSSNVSGGNDRYITINSHGFKRGQRVRYNNISGSSIGGLSNNTIYYIIPYYSYNQNTGWYDDPNRIRLAASEINSYKDLTQGLITTSGSGNHSLTALGGTGGPGARVVTDTDESGDVDAYILMGEGGNGGTSPSGGGNGSSGQGGSYHYSYHHGGGASWVEESMSASTGSGGNGGYRYVTY